MAAAWRRFAPEALTSRLVIGPRALRRRPGSWRRWGTCTAAVTFAKSALSNAERAVLGLEPAERRVEVRRSALTRHAKYPNEECCVRDSRRVIVMSWPPTLA